MDPKVAAAPCEIFPNTRFASRDSTAIDLRTGKDLVTLNRNRVFDPNGITQTLGPPLTLEPLEEPDGRDAVCYRARYLAYPRNRPNSTAV